MANVLFVCLMVGGGMLLLGTLVLATASLGQFLAERRLPGGAERRRYTRVPCVFRAEDAPPSGPLWEGDLSLGGASVKLPSPAEGRRVRLLAMDRRGLAPTAKVEGRVVSMEEKNGWFIHHLAFDPDYDDLTVSAVVASAVWAEPAF